MTSNDNEKPKIQSENDDESTQSQLDSYYDLLAKKYEAMGIARSYNEAQLSLDELLKEISSQEGLLAAGIGINKDRSDFVLKVQVLSDENSDLIPNEVNGIDVEIRISGPIVLRNED